MRSKVDEAAEELARGEGIPLETVVGQLEGSFVKRVSLKINFKRSFAHKIL